MRETVRIETKVIAPVAGEPGRYAVIHHEVATVVVWGWTRRHALRRATGLALASPEVVAARQREGSGAIVLAEPQRRT